MNWSMPRPVLTLVAAILGVACLGVFLLAVLTAPPRGRLPGERPGGKGGEAIQAVEAQPLVAERIEGPPPPKELTPEEKAKLEADKKAKAEAAAKAQAEAEAALTPEAAAPLPVPVVPPPPPPPKAPQREEPVF